MPCNLYKVGDFIVSEDIGTAITDCNAPAFWGQLADANYRRVAADIDWDGKADFAWCEISTTGRCNPARRGTMQTWNGCEIKGWRPTDSADLSVDDQADVLLHAQAVFAENDDCICT